MSPSRRLRIAATLLASLALGLLLGGCERPTAATPAAAGADDAATHAAPLTVFAAASLKESMDAVAEAYRARTGQAVQVSYAGSSALARQIEQRLDGGTVENVPGGGLSQKGGGCAHDVSENLYLL